MKTYVEGISDIVRSAAPIPPIARRHEPVERLVFSDDTKAHMLMLHLEAATYGHPAYIGFQL